jgi:hypothetical protein
MPPKLKIRRAELLDDKGVPADTLLPVSEKAKTDDHDGNDGISSAEQKYLSSLSELELRVCAIARDHLKSSFDLSRSSGYIAWAGKK